MVSTSLQSNVQNFLVNCVGLGFLVIIYFTISLLSPYLVPLFWAIVLSIPLYDIKSLFIDYIEEDLKDDEITLFGVMLTSIHVILEWACSPAYIVFYTVVKSYLKLVYFAFNVEPSETTDSPSSSTDVNLSPGKYLAEKSLKEQKSIISEKLKSTFNKGTFFYFRILLSIGTLAILYELLIVKQLGIVCAFVILILIFLHICYHATRFLSLKYMPSSFNEYLSDYTKSSTKSFILNNTNTLLTYSIVFGSILTGIFISIFLSFECVNEFQYLAVNSMEFVDQFLQNDVKHELHSQLSNVINHGYSYIDDQVFMKNSNLTASDVQIKVQNMFKTLPHVQSLYHNLTRGQFSILLNTTALKLIFDELSQNTYSKNEISMLSQVKGIVTTFLSNIAQNALLTGLNIFTSIITLVSTMFDWIFKIILFLTVLVYLVSNKHSIIHYLTITLEMVDPSHYIVDALETCISSTLSVNLRLGIFYFIFTAISFYICKVPVIFIPAIASSVLAILPFMNPMLIAVVPTVILWLQGHLITSVALIASHVLVSFVVIPLFYEEINGVDPYFGSLSIALGIYTYGLEGTILGPILMSLIPAGYKFLKFYLE
eukprot:NODE_94_length_21515_cov_0.130417.p3 type:complete len:599 gc:universal NODE_94_length_21515_cov_0.130417:2368-4164(+)